LRSKKELSNLYIHKGVHFNQGVALDRGSLVTFFFARYDWLLGIHYDEKLRYLFIFYLPMLCIRIRLKLK